MNINHCCHLYKASERFHEINHHIILESVCYYCLNNSFQYLNNIIRIFTHFSLTHIFTKQQQRY